jgi:putative ABC transport system permease protein
LHFKQSEQPRVRSLWQDIRFGFRTLRRNLGFAAIAVSILGLAVGASTALFGVVNAVLLKELPYAEPARLVAVTRVFRPDADNEALETVALKDLRAWAQHSTSFESASALFFTRTPVRVGETAYLPNTVVMDPTLLSTLGISPAIGTDFDGVQAFDDTVIISHNFWQQAFGGAADVIGRPIFVGGQPRSVRAVLPARFEVPRTDARLYRGPVDVFLPAVEGNTGSNYWGIARLAANVSIEQAEAELRSIVAALNEGAPADDGITARLSPLADERTRNARQPLAILLGIGGVLLLISCTNLVNLLLARSAARVQEMALRKAVGASGGRLVRQQLTESLCLGVLGGGVGIALAAVFVRVFSALSPLRLPIIEGITLDPRVLGFGFATSVGATLLVALGPALFTAVGAARSRSGATARAFPRTQKLLTIIQIALSLGMLAAAGVLSHSLWRLNHVDRGFESERVLGFELSVTGPRDDWMNGRFVSRALGEITAIPGVDSVGYITFLPPETWAAYFAPFRIEGQTPATPARPIANTLTTSADYFRTVGMSVINGRRFEETDDANSRPVAIINEAFAVRYLSHTDPLGQRIVSDFDTRLGREETPREIIGVVNDTRDRGMNQPPRPTIYLPYSQGTLPYGAMALRVRTTPEALIPEINRRLGAINPDVPLTDFQTLDFRIRDSLREPRFYAFLAAVCAAMAAIFVAVGLYGVVSYSVSSRTVELGVRMALGSSHARIKRLVLWRGAVMAFAGAALGLVLALVSMRALTSLLFEVPPLDPLALVGSTLLVAAVALVAAYLPAQRACRLNLTRALRHD